MDINDFYFKENEKPLDHLAENGGFCGIFRTIGCIGDSLSSGEFERMKPDGTKGYYDMFEYSWGQIIARMTGSQVYNFSRGGMTAKEYCCGFADTNRFFSRDKACKAYIIALGVNDVYNRGDEIGSVADINVNNPFEHPDTFAGWYGELVLRLKEIAPDAKFFLVGMPDDVRSQKQLEQCEACRRLFDDMTKLFANTWFLDLYKYAPKYDEKFIDRFYLGGHMNPMGYMVTGIMIASYIDYFVRRDYKQFADVGFINSEIR